MAATRNEAAPPDRRQASETRGAPPSRTRKATPAGARGVAPNRHAPDRDGRTPTVAAIDGESWSLHIPGAGVTVTVDHPEKAAFYAALVTLALVDVIDWPVAAVICVGHVVAARSRNRALRGIAEGMEAGA